MKEVNKLATFNVLCLILFHTALWGIEVHQFLKAGSGNHLCAPPKAHLLIKQKNEQECSINTYWSQRQN